MGIGWGLLQILLHCFLLFAGLLRSDSVIFMYRLGSHCLVLLFVLFSKLVIHQLALGLIELSSCSQVTLSSNIISSWVLSKPS